MYVCIYLCIYIRIYIRILCVCVCAFSLPGIGEGESGLLVRSIGVRGSLTISMKCLGHEALRGHASGKGAACWHGIFPVEHACSSSEHGILKKSHVNMMANYACCSKLEHSCSKTWTCMLQRSWLTPVYLRPQKQEHHRHPTVPTYEARQIPTHNTLVCASRTNNTYTFHALPRKILCQAGTSPKSHCPPALAW